uniref:serine C-palmitoyltransferase n=1 Tax=Rhodosorus marinus TaxID=101924 RepID=A0A7S2ZY80_9RHOD|mmetsp:Transcript_37303/g.148854  ORF Transcript_37303/g.148854 Transcript_37303/m.148854 type:complete len:543 (+) Transcript_37303:572-2200(+)|eukprot:CAMPEP_0113965708 /NCGR_PEP_ID=MMETSP0011_2-20120614/7903_1 /TAXON_ID=101924 /ORGANISM="Rhodosorus marinus" /LENGTH=542 /DNA_ID=CAMNT_0000978267 /DNA_START=213 /DNA_END=1841 /DNA_ORIENTATION=+ /assembly_acc=CAM_ASM_000156
MGEHDEDDKYNNVPYFTALTTYCNYAVIVLLGHIWDFLVNTFGRGDGVNGADGSDYAPYVRSFEDFYARRVYSRVSDCWGRPISSAPGAYVSVIEREDNLEMDWKVDLKPTGKTLDCINLASYNYLGYGELPGGIDQDTLEALDKYGVSTGGNCVEGRNDILEELEETMADFLDKEASIIFGMGFATNSQVLCSLVGPGCLLISDALNHASIVVGSRNSGAKIRTFAHNDARSMENTIRESIATGQPGTGKPWRKILVVVEGIYSMEGEICNLPEIIRVKKKYGVSLFLDEAHSIGAMGGTGRGVCEYWGVGTKDVDIMMGTFTKSFGAVGGYIAGSKDVIDLIRYTSPGALYATTMSPPCIKHISWVLSEIKGEDGTGKGKQRIKQLKENTMYLRRKLAEMGLQIYGEPESPVIPIMIYGVGQIATFSRECLARGLAVVVVGFPATPLILSRARICASAAHTTEDLDKALEIIKDVSKLTMIFYDTPKRRTPALKSPKKFEEKVHASDSIFSSEEIVEHSTENGHTVLPRAAPDFGRFSFM